MINRCNKDCFNCPYPDCQLEIPKNYVDCFPGRLKAAMEKRNISKTELSRKVKVTPPTVYRYLSGESSPSAFQLTTICKELGVSPNWLLGFEDPEQEKYIDAFKKVVAILKEV